jgi:hypothetical protein
MLYAQQEDEVVEKYREKNFSLTDNNLHKIKNSYILIPLRALLSRVVFQTG